MHQNTFLDLEYYENTRKCTFHLPLSIIADYLSSHKQILKKIFLFRIAISTSISNPLSTNFSESTLTSLLTKCRNKRIEHFWREEDIREYQLAVFNLCHFGVGVINLRSSK